MRTQSSVMGNVESKEVGTKSQSASSFASFLPSLSKRRPFRILSLLRRPRGEEQNESL